MDKIDWGKLNERLNGLTESQLKHVFGRLIDHFESDAPPVTEADLEDRAEEERDLLAQAASLCGLPPSASPSGQGEAVQFLAAVAEASPECVQVITEALEDLDHPSETLDFGLSVFAAGVLVPAIAVAIMRPQIVIEEEEVVVGRIKKRKKKTVAKINGTKDIVGVLKAALPFLK